MNKKVLILAANHWTSPSQVGTHSIAKEFVKSGWDVAFISDPISPFHFLKRNKSLITQRLEIYKSGGQKYLSDRLIDRKSTRLNSSHIPLSRMPSSA